MSGYGGATRSRSGCSIPGVAAILAIPSQPAIWLVSELLDLHDNLLAGPTGRTVNGVGAFAVLAGCRDGSGDLVAGHQDMASQPDAASRRGMEAPDLALAQYDRLLEPWIHVGVWPKRDLSRFSRHVQDLADRLEPLTAANAGIRIGDRIIYWLAYLHFGRINGIGIPCSGPGLCDQTTKAIWALFGLAPAAMFVTGAILWWNRVLRPRLASARREAQFLSCDFLMMRVPEGRIISGRRTRSRDVTSTYNAALVFEPETEVRD